MRLTSSFLLAGQLNALRQILVCSNLKFLSILCCFGEHSIILSTIVIEIIMRVLCTMLSILHSSSHLMLTTTA